MIPPRNNLIIFVLAVAALSNCAVFAGINRSSQMPNSQGRIHLDIQNLDIRDVAKYFTRISGQRIFVADYIHGSVSLSATDLVTVGEAFELLAWAVAPFGVCVDHQRVNGMIVIEAAGDDSGAANVCRLNGAWNVSLIRGEPFELEKTALKLCGHTKCDSWPDLRGCYWPFSSQHPPREFAHGIVLAADRAFVARFEHELNTGSARTSAPQDGGSHP